MSDPIAALISADKDEDKSEPKERRSGWPFPTWMMSGLFTVCVALVGVALTMWNNDSVQETNIKYALQQIEELKTDNRSLRQEVGANKQHLENFSAEAIDLMRRLAEQDRFRQKR